MKDSRGKAVKDLDFDELDRAVSSLMSDKKSSSKPETEEQAPLVDETKASEETTPSPSLALDLDTEEADTAPSLADESKTDSQIQKRSTGLYMDMMPMKQQAQPTILKSHGAAAFLSQSDETASPSAQQSSKKSAPFHDIIPPKVTSSPSESNNDQSPNLMALQKSPTAEDTDTQAQLEAALEEQPDQASTPTSPDTVSDPMLSPAFDSLLEAGDDHSSMDPLVQTPPAEDIEAKPEKPVETASPFLADAKVDKRPLGGVATSEQSKEPVDSAAAKNDAEKSTGPLMPSGEMSALPVNDQQNEDTPQAAPAPMPPEFHEDLLAVEADRQADVASVKSQEAPATIEQASAAQVGPLSITQQYKEKLSTGDQSHTPIYDTNVQPLTHPPLKKSGWWVVASIIAVIVVSVGIAAVLYFTGIL